jgi:putative FmdB family regulatory protein
MPTYEYKCEKCNGTFEAFQSMKDEAYTVCPQELCRQSVWGKGKVKRQFGTGAGLIFKGSGFYITDYRSPDYKERAKKETDSSKGESGKTGSEKPSGSGASTQSGGSSGSKPPKGD